MNIRLFPDPVLREKAKEFRHINDEALSLAERLRQVMRINKGCVGIAAPQLGVLKRLAVVDVSANKKAGENHGLLLLFDPKIIHAEGQVVGREGCLSVPDFTGNVTRAESVKVSYLDAGGGEKNLLTSGFEAVVVQHELDHLDGLLFLDRISNMKRDLFKRKNY
jgi:peptide deformylase